MPSGKQLSFQHGEVSPAQRHKANTIQFNNGVAKLRNMFVRRDGGATNRSGFRSYGPSEYQYDVNSLFNTRRIRTFAYYDENGSYCELTCVKTADGNKLYLNDVEITVINYDTTSYSSGGIGFIEPPDPSVIRFTLTKDGVFITPNCYVNVSLSGDILGYCNLFIKGSEAYVAAKDEKITLSSLTVGRGYSGMAPFLPVSYLVTATMKDGRELRITDFASENTTSSAYTGSAVVSGVTIYHPHVSLTSKISLTFTAASVVADVKHFNFYRASGFGGYGKSFYKLAGRVNNLIKTGSLEVAFHDYGADDPSITPPIDMIAFGEDRDPFTPFAGAQCACYYQQRLLTVLDRNYAPALKPGEVVASKLGAPRQFSQPIISMDTGSFIFSVPISDGSGVNGLLSMKRALLFTNKGVYIAQGGEQGILTPSTVNPLKISDEGCTSAIEPVMSGSRGFWINAAKTKLMCATFGDEGNVGVFEASLFSKHFLRKGIVQLEAIGGEEDMVFLVTKDGKLVQATISDEGAFGFSLWETDGFVESVYRSKGSMTFPDDSGGITPEVLMAYVRRKGVRYHEYVEVREDRYRERELFADASLYFGTRLTLQSDGLGSPGFIKEPSWMPWSLWSGIDPYGLLINIEPPVADEHNWEANQTIKIRSNLDLLTILAAQDFVIHFYYPELDEDGKVVLDENERERMKVLRYVIDKDVPAVATGETVDAPWAYTALGYEFQGYFTADVPEQLQDVRSQFDDDPNELGFHKGLTRWAPAFDHLKIDKTDPYIDISPLKMLYDLSEEYDREVVVVAEGEILSSPLNPNKLNRITVDDDGTYYRIDFGEYYGWGYVGLPYVSEFESLDIESGDNRTLTDANKLLNAIGVGLLETRGGFFGMPNRDLDEMEEMVFRTDGDITVQTQNKSGPQLVQIPGEWTQAGRVNIKNVDPVPMTILSVYPKGIAGD